MKNYRFLALPMAMLLIGSAFTGCGSKNDSSAGDSTSTSATDTSREDGGVMSDVEDGAAYAAAVRKLANAGIVGGDAGTGKFRPADGIKRSEACVIFTRIATTIIRMNPKNKPKLSG